MADTPATPQATTDSDVLAAIVELLKTGTNPDVIQAQKILLRRIALEGDVIQSRVPPPRNITEIGGYLNLLIDQQQPEMRAQMLAGILGVAGPNPPLGFDDTGPLVSFVSVPNDRPTGAAQPAMPVTLTIRSDMLDSFIAARNALHALGCALPLLTSARTLPPAGPGVQPPDDVLPLLGRTLDVVPAAVLVDPNADPLAIARLTTDPPGTFRLVAREIDGGTLVPEQQWEAQKCGATSCSVTAAAPHRFQPIAALLADAGWYPPQTQVLPTKLTMQGNLTRFTNITSLVNGVTKLGDELSLLYPPGVIAASSLALRLTWVWNGVTFVAPS